jgi:rhodanese-related sulfurtransferase
MLLCRSGKRAEAIGNLLEVEHGFEHIIIVENGMQGWQEEVDTTLSIY